MTFQCYRTPGDLGITFQANLTFDEHISKITSTENSRLGIIRNKLHMLTYGFPNLVKTERKSPTHEYH